MLQCRSAAKLMTTTAGSVTFTQCRVSDASGWEYTCGYSHRHAGTAEFLTAIIASPAVRSERRQAEADAEDGE